MTQTDATDTATTPSPEPDIRYKEAGTWPLVRRHLLNVLLMIVTLGLYRFWAVTIMRRRLWRRTTVCSQPLEYTGTGLEIFIGFLKVFVVILLPIALSFLAIELLIDRELQDPDADAFVLVDIIDVVYIMVVFMLIEMGRFLIWRYRVSRTRWRGLRGRIELPARKYLIVALASAAMVVFSGWLLKPLVDLVRASYVINALNLGGLKGRYTGGTGALIWFWVGIGLGHGLVVIVAVFAGGFVLGFVGATDNEAAIGTTIALGVLATMWFSIYVLSMYRVAFWRHICSHSTVGPIWFRFSGNARNLAVLTLSNWMILIFSLGLLAPITWERKIRYLSKHVAIFGLPDPSDLRQVEEDSNAVGGEGLAGDFDIA